MYCGKSQIPLGTKVKIIKSEDTEFLENCTGVAMHPFYLGCKEKDWIGVLLDQETDYGKKFNFHIEEIELL